MELAGPLGTKLGLAHWKRASSRGEAGTSGFLSVTDSNFRVPAELGQESQASSCLRKGTPLASRDAHRVSGPSSSCVWNPRVFPNDARGCQCLFVLCLHPQGPSKRCPGIGLFSRVDRDIGVAWDVAPPTWLVSNFLVRLASS